ncbi:DUF6443 domain-containing protein [Flavobacterium supellecticarium]|nr:DUF6443 domain-containing protein [Flavobacterium supellecticarium]
MKKLLIALLCAPIWMVAQTNSQNWTKKTTYRDANSGRPVSTVTYYDGLGRPVQQNINKQSGNGKDLITHIEYDKGRQLKEYLPYPATSNDMSYQAGAQSATLSYSQYSGQYPFSEKIVELSPLARILKQGAPGVDWQVNPNANTDHTIKMDYQTNGANEVKNYFALTNWDNTNGVYAIQLQDKGYYSANSLYKTVIKDENWTSGTNNTTEEFTDKNGLVVLKRSYNDGAHDTYYVYDIYGNQTYVLPPLVTNPTAQLDDLCYQYKYDSRNRMVEKKLPGKQWEFIVYDKIDRVVATGPALSPFGSPQTGYLITKYDALDRTLYTGWLQTNSTRATLQGQYNAAATIVSEERTKVGVTETVDNIAISYTNRVLPTSGMKLLTVNYYDDYRYINAITPPSLIEDQTVATSVTGQVTGSWVRVLTTAEETLNEQSYTLYDPKYRPISVCTANHLSGYTRVDSKLDFSGKMLYSQTFHKLLSNSASELNVVDSYIYTEEDRLLLHKHKINDEAEQLLTKNTYDELGQLVSKNVGGSDITGAVGLQKVDYRYNIRGWMTDINNDAPIGSAEFQLGNGDLFGFKINYNQVTEVETARIIYSGSSVNGEVKPLYNGNIAETFWLSFSDNQIRKYGYRYDALNRLRKAYYQKPLSTVPISNSYNEEAKYDKNGNITSLKRNGNLDNPLFPIEIDDLTYTYNGNKLLRVDDATNNPEGFKDNGYGNTYDDYTYDVWGNMTKNLNKGISNIIYNHLNLPTEILFNDGNKITYLYNAEGVKLQKRVITSESNIVTDYQKGFYYVDQTLKFFPHAEGYVNVTEGKFLNYVFNYVDHLGNIRSSWTWDDKVGIVQAITENHFYPFGERHKSYNNQSYVFIPSESGPSYYSAELIEEGTRTPTNFYMYKYNGKELQNEFGLSITAMDFRQYDNTLGRFNSQDLLSESFPDSSPYSFSFSNPVALSDPSGLCPECPDKNNAKNGDTYLSTGGGNYSFNNGNWTRNDGDLNEIVISVNKPETSTRKYGGDGSGSALDISARIADGINQFNPIAGLWDVLSYTFTGKDRFGNKMSTLEASVTAVSIVPALKGVAQITKSGATGVVKTGSRVFEVGSYNKLRGVEVGLDAHHAGQKALMSKFVPGYNPSTAPSILVPKLGHTQGVGVLSRNMSGFSNARQVLARDIFELRRVYPSIPYTSLKELIQMNKTMYPHAFIK